MITYNNIVSKFEEFAQANDFIQTFSHGSPSDVDLDKLETFPLMHLVYTGGGYNENIKTYNLEVYILDNPPRNEDKTGFQKSVISQCEMVAEDILADIENGGNIFTFGFYYELQNASITPLEDERSNILAGTLLSLSIGVAYQYDACNAPLTGVDPQGSSTGPFRARGLLRVKEVDGAPDVLSVATMTLPNGSLTDDGEGAVSLTFPAPTSAGLVSDYTATSTEFDTGLGVANHPISFGSILAGEITLTPALRAGYSGGFNLAGTVFQSSSPTQGSTYDLTFTCEIRGALGSTAIFGAATKAGMFTNYAPQDIVISGDGEYATYTLTDTSVLVSVYETTNTIAIRLNVAAGSWDVRNPTMVLQINHA